MRQGQIASVLVILACLCLVICTRSAEYHGHILGMLITKTQHQSTPSCIPVCCSHLPFYTSMRCVVEVSRAGGDRLRVIARHGHSHGHAKAVYVAAARETEAIGLAPCAW